MTHLQLNPPHELPFASQHLHYDFETTPIESVSAYFKVLGADEALYGHWKTLLRGLRLLSRRLRDG